MKEGKKFARSFKAVFAFRFNCDFGGSDVLFRRADGPQIAPDARFDQNPMNHAHFPNRVGGGKNGDCARDHQMAALKVREKRKNVLKSVYLHQKCNFERQNRYFRRNMGSLGGQRNGSGR